MKIIASLDEIADRYDAVLCDVWGVIHNGKQAYPDACAALARFRAAGKPVILLTNIPKPRAPIPAQLDRLNVPRDAWDLIVTSGDATRAVLATRAPGPMYKIGPAGDRVLWDGLGLVECGFEEARFIGISGLNRDDETPEDYAPLLKAARARDMELISANPDIVVRFGDKLYWCAGAIAREYEALGGRVVMAGKPHAPIYELAYRELETLTGRAIGKSRILAIGDGIGTDIAGADAQGIDSLFVASGMHGEALWSDGVLDTAKLDEAFAAEKHRATYVARVLE